MLEIIALKYNINILKIDYNVISYYLIRRYNIIIYKFLKWMLNYYYKII